MFEKLINKLEILEPLVSMTDKPDVTNMAKFLYERISNHDSYLVFLGETSSGKSSIINGLLGEDILPMKANPSTAAITEVELKDEGDTAYYAINKNATIEKIDKHLFLQLSEQPDDNLKRLKVVKKVQNRGLNNLRIFDTPGYGSIVEEHEEVLKDFLPNSDIIVYTVNYKIGIQDEDYVFLGFLRELIRPDVKIILLVNRCPQDIDNQSMKIRKIKAFVSDILTIEPDVFTIPNIEAEESQGHPLPHNDSLWHSVANVLSAPERTATLYNAFDGYIHDLYDECLKVIEARYISSTIDTEEFESVKKKQEDSANRIRQAIPELIEPTFDKIKNALPAKIQRVRDNVQNQVEKEIDSKPKLEKDEMVAFTNSHLLPHTIKVETKEIQNYIDIELEDLNKRVDDYLQKEMVRFNNEIIITLQTNVGVASSKILAGIIKNVGNNALRGYFVAFGGMGGANAGIANAASHLLKQAGDLFGHVFSKGTHNGLKHFLSKIGATSMKAIGAAIAVVTELLFLVYDLATWKKTLCKGVNKGLNKWKDETNKVVIDDLLKLCDENKKTISSIADDFAHMFDDEQPTDIDKCREEYEFAVTIGKQIGIE